MEPVTKRPRVAAQGKNAPLNRLALQTELLEQHEKTVAHFLDDLDAIESSDLTKDRAQGMPVITGASSTLLELRSLQRKLLQAMQDSQESVRNKRPELERQSMALQNLTYERKYLEKQTKACREYHTPYLEKMCRDETTDAEDDDIGEKDDSSVSRIMNEFLCGSADKVHSDPKQQKIVMTKLHKELNLRGNLERDLTQARQAFKEKQAELQKKRAFLKDVPKKLREMEVASLPLQRFFQKSELGTSPSSTVRFIGSQRKDLFDEARTTLAGPLYVLFVQLQYYIDAFPKEGLELEISTLKPEMLGNRKRSVEKKGVLLHFPIPDVTLTAKASNNTKRVTVEFNFYSNLRLVTAACMENSENIDFPLLLVNIFPGDSGERVVNGSNIMTHDNAHELTDNLCGRPYNWCNYMAGLNFPEPLEKDQQRIAPMEKSTKSIVKTLTKRLHARATLKHIIKILERKPDPIPMHPAMEEGMDNTECIAKLKGWTKKSVSEETSEHKRTYLAIIKRGTSSLSATVTLDVTNYPAKPPVWILTGAEQNWGEKHGSLSALESGSAPLYDTRLSQLEEIVNFGIDKLVVKDYEETYEWVLAHQLRRLIESWDAMQKAVEQGIVPLHGPDRRLDLDM